MTITLSTEEVKEYQDRVEHWYGDLLAHTLKHIETTASHDPFQMPRRNVAPAAAVAAKEFIARNPFPKILPAL